MYVISDPSQPHAALGVAATLEEIADALVARPEPDLMVYASRDGLSRALDSAEQRELDDRVRAARLLSAKGGRAHK